MHKMDVLSHEMGNESIKSNVINMNMLLNNYSFGFLQYNSECIGKTDQGGIIQHSGMLE